MKIEEFENLPHAPKKFKVGECFLEGRAIINQVGTKQVGEWVTYFKIIGVNENNKIEYIPVTEKLEE